MQEEWMPTECVFLGKAEEFPKAAYLRLKKRGVPCDPWTAMIRIFPPGAVPHQLTDHPICSITAWQMGGNRSRLEFKLLSFKGVIGDWAAVREPIEQLLDDLRADKWLEPFEKAGTRPVVMSTDCIFKGTVEKFYSIAAQQLDDLGISYERTSPPWGLTVYPRGVNLDAWLDDELRNAVKWISEPQYEAKPLPLYIIKIQEIPGEQCSLNFSLSPGAENWAIAMPQIEMLLEDLRRVGWIEIKTTTTVDDLSKKSADEVQPLPSKLIPKNELLHCNRWLFDQYFNHGRTDYQELREEWLRIRKDKDFRPRPTNPIANMRTAINEEKGRRSIG